MSLADDDDRGTDSTNGQQSQEPRGVPQNHGQGDSGKLPPSLSTGEVARLANVTSSTVSNWRARPRSGFPEPITPSNVRPRFNRAEVEHWLAENEGKFGENVGPGGRALDVAGTGIGTAPWFKLMSNLDPEERDSLRVVWKWLGRDDPGKPLHIHAGVPLIPPALLRDLQAREIPISALRYFTALRGKDTEVPGEFSRKLSHTWDQLDRSGLPSVWALSKETIDLLGLHNSNDPLEPIRGLIAGLAGAVSGPILDPVVGSTNLLSMPLLNEDHVERYGVAPDEKTASAAWTRSILNDQKTKVVVGQSLKVDPFADLRVDLVVADVPVGIAKIDDATALLDPRWSTFGIPSHADNEWAYMEHAVARLTQHGRAILLTRATTLHDMIGPNPKIRANLVRLGAVEAVIVLPSGIRRARETWPLAIWILRKPQPGALDQGVLIVDASAAQPSELSSSDRYVAAYRAFFEGIDLPLESAGFATVVPTANLNEAGAILTPNRWLIPAASEADGTDLKIDLMLAAKGARESVATMSSAAIQLSVDVRQTPALLVTVGELREHKLIRVRGRGMPSSPSTFLNEASGYPVLTIPHLDAAGGANVETTFVPRDDKTERQLIRAGDVIVYVDGGVVKATVWRKEGWFLGKFLNRITVDSDLLLPEFLAACLMSESNSRFVVTGAVRSQVDLEQLEIPMLDRESQIRYVRLAASLATAREDIAEAGTRVEQLTQALANAVATGKVDIGHADSDRPTLGM